MFDELKIKKEKKNNKIHLVVSPPTLKRKEKQKIKPSSTQFLYNFIEIINSIDSFSLFV